MMLLKFVLYFLFTFAAISVPSALVWRWLGDGWGAATMLVMAAVAMVVGVLVL